jgi:branched-chain amino acid transport system permease protein
MVFIKRVSRTLTMRWWLIPVVSAILICFISRFASQYVLYIGTSWVAFGIVALGLDLFWGKEGDLSLGHTTFFGLGAYLYGIVAINAVPVIGGSVFIAVITGSLIGGIVAAMIGYFLFYGRLGPIQTTIITYTLVLLMYTFALGLSFHIGSAEVGGANGMTNIPPLAIGVGSNTSPLSRYGMLVAAISIATLIYIGVKSLLRQPFGLVIDGIRQNILKVELLGYDVRWYRFVVFTISGAIAGIGGAIFAAWANYVSPSVFGVEEALLIPIYVLAGGVGSLVGAFVGAVFIGGLSFWLGGGAVGGETTLVLGLCLIFLVLVAPQGLIGLLSSLRRRIRRNGNHFKVVRDVGVKDVSVDRIFTRQPQGTVLFRTERLYKHFGGVTATDNVELSFSDNGIQCLIGPNGAGKSTFLNICLGLVKPDGGKIYFESTDITGWDPYRRVKYGLGIKLQVVRIFDEMTTRQNLWLAAYRYLHDKRIATSRVREILHIIGLTERADIVAGELSHGEQQWVDIGMVLCMEPKLIFLDEPTAGMTRQERQQTVGLLKRISKFAGIVVVEHDMEFVRDLDCPVTVLHQGALFASGSIDELRRDDRVLDIYLGRQQDV